MPREIEVYHAIAKENPTAHQLIRFFKGEEGWKLISTSRNPGEKMWWGTLGVILKVPEENILHVSSVDAGTPVEFPFDEHTKTRVMEGLLHHAGIDAGERHQRALYDEVVIQPHQSNQIVGVFYRTRERFKHGC